MPFEAAEELNVSTDHVPGALGRVLKAVADAKVGVRAFCAWGMGTEANVMLVPTDAKKAKAALKKAGYKKVSSSRVVVATVPDKVGAGARVASGAGAKNVNLDYAYASGTGRGAGVIVLGAGKSSAKLAKALK